MDLGDEIWKDIRGYEGKYQISNYGKIKSLSRLTEDGRRKTKEFLIKQFDNKQGYLQISLFKENKKTTHAVHRLLAQHFIENPKGLTYVNHIDGNKKNNDLSNLEWCTPQQNTRHAWKLGLCSTEKYKHFSKPVMKIDKNNNLIKVYESQREASKDNNVSYRAINNCLKGLCKKSGGYKWIYYTKGVDYNGFRQSRIRSNTQFRLYSKHKQSS